MILFYTKNIQGNTAVLEDEEARHATQVLRRKIGDAMQLTDGLGNLYSGEIVDITKKSCIIGIKETQAAYNKRPVHLHIAIAPTKNIDRFEWFLEKATEIGIDEITPLLCKRSERTIIKPDRLNGILISAMKQSFQTYLPKLNEVLDFQKFMKQDFSQYNQKLIAHCLSISDFGFQISDLNSQSEQSEIRNPKSEIEKPPLSKTYQKGKNVVILIGPEGDFTEHEVGLAFERSFKGISLGHNRLRTETAGLVACHTVNVLNM